MPRAKHHFCVVYWVYGSLYRWRGYYYTKRDAIRDFMEGTGCSREDIFEVYKEDDQW